MAYQEINTTYGLYLIDYEQIDNIISNSFYFQSYNNFAKFTIEKEGWGLPETYHWKVDFKVVNSVAKNAPHLFKLKNKFTILLREHLNQRSSLTSGSDIENIREELFYIEKSGRNARAAIKHKIDSASKQAVENINSKVDTYSAALEVAKFTRDTSIEIILISSTMVTGGAATLAIGAGGSLFKGAAKWQDTGKLGAATLEAGTSFATFLIPGPKTGASKATARLLVFAKATTEFGGSTLVGLAEGKGLGEASLSAGLDVGLGAVVNGLNGKLIPKEEMEALLKSGLENYSVPVGLSLMNTSMGRVKKTANDESVKYIMAMVKKENKRKSVVGLKKVKYAGPVLVDWAIIGPDRSTQTRKWVKN